MMMMMMMMMMSSVWDGVVQVLDEFEGDEFFVMTMEKHGSGVDLFEFIETAAYITEPLASYVFRQVIQLCTVSCSDDKWSK